MSLELIVNIGIVLAVVICVAGGLLGARLRCQPFRDFVEINQLKELDPTNPESPHYRFPFDEKGNMKI